MVLLHHVLVRKYVHVWGDYTKEQNYWIIEYACSQFQHLLPNSFPQLL